MERGASDARFPGYELPVYAGRIAPADPRADTASRHSRAQWAVLAKVERNEGLKQTELAEQMEMQPITLTRLIDKLCANDWIERRGDETDRRVNRLYLRKAARRCSASSPASAPNTAPRSGTNRERTACSATESIKENVRNAIQKPAGEPPQEQRYG